MADPVRIRLEPLGQTLELARGTPLRDALFACGVEFPCGGRGRCKRCRVRVISGSLPASAREKELLSAGELAAGWRLACHAQAAANATLEIAQWEVPILSDNTRFEFEPRPGYGIAVDLGTTTIVAQLLDLRNGEVKAVRSVLNPQAVHGADIMTRVQFAIERGAARLTSLIRTSIGAQVRALLRSARLDSSEPLEIALVGNTVMHHLFCGIDVSPLAHVPFEPVCDGPRTFSTDELEWEVRGSAPVRFLGCLGGFVGSDILAGLLATRIGASEEITGLIDLGTNGEIAFGTRGHIVCASTAAGPAFEGGRISTGMRAASGAIAEITTEGGRLHCRVLGDIPPRGICGSGLVDAVAAGLELGRIQPNGRLQDPARPFALLGPVTLAQQDIRELQLAKGAVAAGIRMVLSKLGARPEDVERVYLAGAFGNYINRTSARRLGLLPFQEDRIEPAGNTALLGAKIALCRPGFDYAFIRGQVEHIPLASDPAFQQIYVDEMAFPRA